MWCREPGKYWYAGDLRQLSVAPSGMKGLEWRGGWPGSRSQGGQFPTGDGSHEVELSLAVWRNLIAHAQSVAHR